jgi:hypothetical protein
MAKQIHDMEVSWFPTKKFKPTTREVIETIFWDVHKVILVNLTPSGVAVNASHYHSTSIRPEEAVH